MVDIVEDSNEKLWVPGRGYVPMKKFAEELRTGARIGDPLEFSSQLPSQEAIIAAQSGDRSLSAFTKPRDAAGRMMLNFQKGVTTAFYNKVIDTGFMPGFAGGAMTDLLPDYNQLFTRGAKGLGAVINGDMSLEDLGAQALDMAFTGAIKLLSKIPVVGQIIAALLAVAYMIVKLVQRNKQIGLAAWEAERQKGEATLPKFPTIGRDTDEDVMETFVIPRMGTTDWTKLFLPRFDWTQDWIGRMYTEGMGFAPGKRPTGVNSTSDAYFMNGKFTESDKGLGYIPGTQQITSVVEVLSPIVGINHQPYNILGANLPGGHSGMMAKLLWNGPPHIQGMAYNNSGKAIGPGNVRDSGDFLPSASQVMTAVWGHMQMDGNPDIYRIDTNLIDRAWQEYCGNGMEYVQNMVQWKFFPTTQINEDIDKEYAVSKGGKQNKRKAPQKSWMTRRRKGAEATFAGGVACAIGSWRCRKYGNTFSLSHPDDISKSTRFETSAGKSSLDPSLKDCVVRFNDWVKAKDDGLCIGNMYDDFIKEKVAKIAARQWSMLSSTMVCVYVKKDFIAFKKSEKLKKRLDDMRKVMLGRPDQWHYIVEQDVPRDEKLEDGRNLYEELKKRGAFKKSFETTLTAGKKHLPKRALKPESRVFQLIPGAILEPGSGISGRVPGEEYVPPGAGMGGSRGGGGSALPVLAVAALAFLVLSKK